jgi:ribosomal protein L11 methyltransferase
VANIIADIIIRLFDELEPHLAPGGQLLASGIIDERLEDVERAAAAHGLAIRRRLEQDGWEALLICRQQDREGEA